MKNESVLRKRQEKKFSKKVDLETNGYDFIAGTVRYDDRCGNGYNYFSITCETTRRGIEYSGGCLHDEIEKHFPELSHLIKWHLVSSDGPMYYIENTMYHAKENGPLRAWVHYKDENHPLKPSACKYCDIAEAEEFLRADPEHVTIKPDEKTAKKADVDAARRCAIWPDATLEQLRDKEQLIARLPALMDEFRKDIEAFGFTF